MNQVSEDRLLCQNDEADMARVSALMEPENVEIGRRVWNLPQLKRIMA